MVWSNCHTEAKTDDTDKMLVSPVSVSGSGTSLYIANRHSSIDEIYSAILR